MIKVILTLSFMNLIVFQGIHADNLLGDCRLLFSHTNVRLLEFTPVPGDKNNRTFILHKSNGIKVIFIINSDTLRKVAKTIDKKKTPVSLISFNKLLGDYIKKNGELEFVNENGESLESFHEGLKITQGKRSDLFNVYLSDKSIKNVLEFAPIQFAEFAGPDRVYLQLNDLKGLTKNKVLTIHKNDFDKALSELYNISKRVLPWSTEIFVKQLDLYLRGGGILHLVSENSTGIINSSDSKSFWYNTRSGVFTKKQIKQILMDSPLQFADTYRSKVTHFNSPHKEYIETRAVLLNKEGKQEQSFIRVYKNELENIINKMDMNTGTYSLESFVSALDEYIRNGNGLSFKKSNFSPRTLTGETIKKIIQFASDNLVI